MTFTRQSFFQRCELELKYCSCTNLCVTLYCLGKRLQRCGRFVLFCFAEPDNLKGAKYKRRTMPSSTTSILKRAKVHCFGKRLQPCGGRFTITLISNRILDIVSVTLYLVERHPTWVHNCIRTQAPGIPLLQNVGASQSLWRHYTMSKTPQYVANL